MSTVSAVMVSRNDGYGGNLLERASYAFNSFLHCVDELIYVDWNSPGQDLASAVLPNLSPAVQSKLRVFKINADFVREHVKGPAQGCVEVLGRNIGIRRATGDWIISTNIDIVCPPTVPVTELDMQTFYTYQRRNIDFATIRHINYGDYQGLSNYLQSVRASLPAAGPAKARRWLRRDLWSLWECCGDFQLAHRNVWHIIRGFEESLIGRNFTDSNVQKKAVLAGFALVPKEDLLVCHINHQHGGTGAAVYNSVTAALFKFKRTTNPDTWGFVELPL